MRDLIALRAYNNEVRTLPFSWDRATGHCCVVYCAGAVKAQTGRDFLAGRPVWSSQEQAVAILQEGGGLEAILDQLLTPIAPSLAQRGDVAGLVTSEGLLLLAMVDGDTVLGPDVKGLRARPRNLMKKAWSVE